MPRRSGPRGEGNWRRPLPDGCQQQPNTEPLSLSHLSHSAICESRSVAQNDSVFRRFLQNLLDDTLRDSRITLPCSLRSRSMPIRVAGRQPRTNRVADFKPSIQNRRVALSASSVSAILTSIILIYVNTSSNSPAHSDRPGKASSSFTQGKLSEHWSALIDGRQIPSVSTSMIHCVQASHDRMALFDSNQPQTKGEGRFESNNARNNIDDAAIVVEC